MRQLHTYARDLSFNVLSAEAEQEQRQRAGQNIEKSASAFAQIVTALH